MRVRLGRRAGPARLALPFAVVAGGLTAVAVLVPLVTGHNPLELSADVWRFNSRLDSAMVIVNRAVPLYLSGLAVAIGLEMGLFNLGVEGQYRLAALLAAAVGAAVHLPPVLHVALILAVAMATGAAWSSVAAVLRVRARRPRGALDIDAQFRGRRPGGLAPHHLDPGP